MDTKDTTEPEKTAEKSPERRPAGARTHDQIKEFLSAQKAEGNHAWPLESARLLTYIGAPAWVTCVNYERAERGQDPLSDDDALQHRAKIFD